MKNLQNFEFENQQVRTLTINDEPYFVGKDVAKVLGYKDTVNTLKKHVDEDDKMGCQIATPSRGLQKMTVINESGLYSLILSSKLPTAKKFKRWVTHEVLPTIRKHGAYMTDKKIEEVLTDPDTIIRLATQLKEEKQGRLVAEQRVNELEPKASYYDKILSNPALVTITAIAKDYGMSGVAMNHKLHALGVQYKQGRMWLLYAKYAELGWTQSETYTVPKKDGTEKVVMNTKWTQKGRLGIYEMLKQDGILPLIERKEIA